MCPVRLLQCLRSDAQFHGSGAGIDGQMCGTNVESHSRAILRIFVRESRKLPPELRVGTGNAVPVEALREPLTRSRKREAGRRIAKKSVDGCSGR